MPGGASPPRPLATLVTDPWTLACVAALALALGIAYGSTLCPTVYWYDSAEFAAHAVSMTASHPPGYPTYTTIAHLFSYLGPEPAWGVNLMSAVFAVLSCACAFLLQRQLGVHAVIALATSLGLGLSPTLWANASMAEVYAPGLAFSLATFVLLFEAAVRPPTEARRWWFAACLVAGLGMGVHMSIATLGLGYAWIGLGFGIDAKITRAHVPTRRVLSLAGGKPRLVLLAIGVALVLVGMLPFIGMVGGKPADFVDPARWAKWLAKISGGAFRGFFGADVISEAMGMRAWRRFTTELGYDGCATALVGLAVLVKRHGPLGSAIVLGLLGNLWFFFDYKVHDIEVFFIPAYALAFVAIGALAQAAFERIGQFEPLTSVPRKHVLLVAMGALLVAGPLSRASLVQAQVDLSEAREARAYADTLDAELPVDAVFVSYSHPKEWKRYAVLLYLQRGLGRRTDVEVWRYPKLDKVQARLDAGQPVLAFDDVGRTDRTFKLRQSGPWLTVRAIKISVE